LASSKEQLVTTVFKRWFREAVRRIETRFAETADPKERILTYVAAIGDEMRRRSPASYEDMRSFEPTEELYRLNVRGSVRRIRDLIHDGVEAGVFRKVHGEFVGEAVALLIEGMMDGRLFERTGLTSYEAWKELSTFAMAALINDPNADQSEASQRTSA
jgi:hypothetical protein